MSLLADEEGQRRIFELERARAWSRSGFIDARQLAAIEAAGPPAPGLAGTAMRLLLFGLTAAAMLAFFALFFGFSGDKGTAGASMLVQGVLALAAGEYLASKLRLHRFGAEEALQLGGALMLALSAALLWSDAFGRERGPLIAGGAAGLASFGFVYARRRHPAALLGAIASAACVVDGFEPAHPRAALALAWTALLAASFRRREVPEFEHELWQALQGALALLVPVTVNLRLEGVFSREPSGEGLAYWGSYAAVWLLPAATLAWGMLRRHRPLLVAGILGLLLALLANKPYWGLERRDWDPALLGLLLTAVAAGVERWLRTGPQGRRDGFTAEEVVVPREELSAAATLVAAAAPSTPAAGPAAAPSRPDFGGGSSGGAGASDSF